MPDFEVTFRFPGVSGGPVEQITAGESSLTSTERANLRVVRQHIEAIKAHDTQRMEVLLDDLFELNSDTLPTPNHRTDRNGFFQIWNMLWRGFPDAAYWIDEDFIARDDYVVVLWQGTGTHQGDFVGIPPTGNQTDIHGCSVYKLKDGKIVQDWDYWDTGILLRQLGLMPAQPGAGVVPGSQGGERTTEPGSSPQPGPG